MTRLSHSELQNRHCQCPSRGLTTTRGCSLSYRTRMKVRENHFLFPTLLALKTTMDPLVEDEQEMFGSKHACIILRGPRSKPKLENILLPTWVAANARIMHKLTNTGT